MAFSVDHLAPFINRISQARHCYVGYSGGLDSHVLLHVLRGIVPPQAITAIHINHQLSPSANQWVSHCENVCKALNVNFVSQTVDLDQGGGNLEKAARDARYQVFESLLAPEDMLLLAHHQDDQAETILYRLLRGSGPAGLSGIPEQRRLGKGTLLRPLLATSRAELEHYAQLNGLTWVDDESNADQQFDRNFIRHQVMPVIAERWPDYRTRLCHSAELSQQASLLLEDQASHDLEQLNQQQQRLGWSIDCHQFLQYSRPRQANVLRLWIKSHQLAVPGHKIINTIVDQAVQSGDDTAMQVDWDCCSLRKYRGRLFLLPSVIGLDDGQCAETIEWPLSNPLTLADNSVLSAKQALGKGIKLAEADRLRVTFRQGGERCQPAGRQGSNKLKKLFQEYGLEPWLRTRVPLVYQGDKLVAVGDLWVCEPFAAKPGEKGYQLQWRYG